MAVKAWSPNHWSAREVPSQDFSCAVCSCLTDDKLLCPVKTKPLQSNPRISLQPYRFPSQLGFWKGPPCPPPPLCLPPPMSQPFLNVPLPSTHPDKGPFPQITGAYYCPSRETWRVLILAHLRNSGCLNTLAGRFLPDLGCLVPFTPICLTVPSQSPLQACSPHRRPLLSLGSLLAPAHADRKSVV